MKQIIKTVLSDKYNTSLAMNHKDKSIIYIGIIAIILMAWLYLLLTAEQHDRMDMEMAHTSSAVSFYSQTIYEALALFLMWSVMMVAMMLPSVLPATTLFAAFNLRKRAQAQAYVRTYIFVAGYLLVWSLCGLLFALVQLGLATTGMLDGAMKTGNLLSGSILLFAGIYQWTPFKAACLKRCRTPLGFFIERWRQGHWGAIYMGWCYGLFCIGCCWALMAIMFSVGTMNILWMAMLSIFVLCEKNFPASILLKNIAGVLLASWGTYLLFS